ncbi:MAG: hypothetical protein WB586_09425 [Chthoniobacterales bacterium]
MSQYSELKSLLDSGVGERAIVQWFKKDPENALILSRTFSTPSFIAYDQQAPGLQLSRCNPQSQSPPEGVGECISQNGINGGDPELAEGRRPVYAGFGVARERDRVYSRAGAWHGTGVMALQGVASYPPCSHTALV